ncbi:MAG: deaminase [Pelobium sp.]
MASKIEYQEVLGGRKGDFEYLIIDGEEFEIQSSDAFDDCVEVFLPKKYLADFPIQNLLDSIVINVCDSIGDNYDDSKPKAPLSPVIHYNGLPYSIKKIAERKISMSFDDSGRRKFWDGEIGFKLYMEAKRKAIEARANEVGDIKLDDYDDDGDYIVMNFSCELETENLSNAITYSEQIISQIETATNFILDEKLKKMVEPKDENELIKFQETNLEIMKLAIENGKQSISEEGKLSPKVGAAIIKDGKLLGIAFRGQKGEGDHAEYTLFEKVLQGQDVSGATIFTTLEPCTHRNNHKPCSDWIIEKGIKHVVIGYLDPNPKIYNNGCKKLKAAGIEISYFPKELREEIMNDNAKFIEQYNANPNLSGSATFDYTNNNGLYIIGNNEMIFETMWTSAGQGSIHAYNDPGTIKAIAIADGCKEINEIKDGSIYNSSSRARTIHEGEILIVENINGFVAAIKIVGVKIKGGTDSINELNFEFCILDNKTSNFHS